MKPMNRGLDVIVTALAPAVWGSTYLVTTEFLPPDHPITMAATRALPAGLLLLLFVRKLPGRDWLGKVMLVGALNFSIFFCCLFIAAYRLPGGVAATLGAMQALFVIALARGLLGTPVRLLSVIAALSGVFGVALLVLGPEAALDPIGVAAGIGGSASMGAGTVLTRKWQPPVSALTFTAWQLTAGGLLLVPVAMVFEPSLPPLEPHYLGGIAYLSLIGGAATYYLWFRGVARIEPSAVSMLPMMSPMTAVILGWVVLGQTLSLVQWLGAAIVLGSVWAGQRVGRVRTGPERSGDEAIGKCNSGQAVVPDTSGGALGGLERQYETSK
ncbi:EamA family transporter [uncultured Roseibium sp.]|uniref:EamA family transporter n=1 Tax=uncultured Roseibium sp. TaxID=1936171 RepID=UPI003217E722